MDRTLMLRFPQNFHCVKAPRHLFVGGRKCPLYNIILARDDVPRRPGGNFLELYVALANNSLGEQ